MTDKKPEKKRIFTYKCYNYWHKIGKQKNQDLKSIDFIDINTNVLREVNELNHTQKHKKNYKIK